MKTKDNRFIKFLSTSILIALLFLVLGYIIYYLFNFNHYSNDLIVDNVNVEKPSAPVVILQDENDETLTAIKEVESCDELQVDTIKSEDVPPLVIEKDTLSEDEQLDWDIEEKAEIDVDNAVVNKIESDIEVTTDFTSGENIAQEEVKSVKVPNPPFMFEPLVIDNSEFEFTAPSTPVYDDDYFKDFFVQGDDTTLLYDDGIYYLTLIVNDEEMGSLEVKFEQGRRELSTSFLYEAVEEYLTEDAKKKIFDNAPSFIDATYLESKGVKCEINDYEFIVRIKFSISDMPIKIISLSGNNKTSSQNYALTGAEELKHAFFSWVTNYNLFLNLNSYLNSNLSILSTSFSTANYLSIGPVNLDFFYSLNTINEKVDFNFSSYQLFHDFSDKNIRLTIGNISTYTLSNVNTPIGIQFEKNYSFGSGSAKTNQYYQIINVYEDSELVIKNNEGVEILRKTLSPGKYRIKDFLLNNGINEITIRLIPLSGKGLNPDGSDQGVEEWHLKFAFDGQLLAKGDTLYGGSISIGRLKVPVGSPLSGAFKLRVSPFYYYEYYFNDLAINYWQDVGLTDNLTFGFEAAVSSSPNPVLDNEMDLNAVFTTNLISANYLGTTAFKMVTGLSSLFDNQMPRVYLMLTHRFKMDNPYISSLAVQLGYQNSSYLNTVNDHRFESAVTFSGALGMLKYSIATALNFETAYSFASPEFVTNSSFSISPLKNLSISASLSINKNFDSNAFVFGGNISATISMGQAGSITSSTNCVDSANVNMFGRFGKAKQHYLQLLANNILFKDLQKTNFGLGYSYTGNLFGFNFRSQVFNKFKAFSNSLSLTTSSAFADGVFTIAKSVSDNFMLIKTEGALKGGEIAIARSKDNSSKVLKTRFGTALYDELSSHRRNNVVLYVTNKDGFSDLQTFSYELNPSSRDAYVAKLNAKLSYTATGILLGKDGMPMQLFSSPIYKIKKDENGNEIFVKDENLYLFTDQDGRYILSGLYEGSYFFDLPLDEHKWVCIHFDITDENNPKQNIIEFESVDMRFIEDRMIKIQYDMDGNLIKDSEIEYTKYLSGYYSTIDLNKIKVYESEEFWNTLFPPFEEEEEFVFEELSSDF